MLRLSACTDFFGLQRRPARVTDVPVLSEKSVERCRALFQGSFPNVSVEAMFVRERLRLRTFTAWLRRVCS